VTSLRANLPGHPDNLSTGADGRIWCAMVSPVNAAAEWLAPRMPGLRRLLWKLPDRLQPQIKPEVWAVAFDPDTGEAVAGLHTEHPSFGMVTGRSRRPVVDGMHRRTGRRPLRRTGEIRLMTRTWPASVRQP